MRSADASLLVGSLAGNWAAQAFIREEGPVWVSHLVLAETVRALEGVHGRARPRMALPAGGQRHHGCAERRKDSQANSSHRPTPDPHLGSSPTPAERRLNARTAK